MIYLFEIKGFKQIKTQIKKRTNNRIYPRLMIAKEKKSLVDMKRINFVVTYNKLQL